jgi:hypothetical protein
MVGEMADGGGDLRVVSDVEFVVTVLFVVDSVTIGTGSGVVVSCATAAVDNIPQINNNHIFILIN